MKRTSSAWISMKAARNSIEYAIQALLDGIYDADSSAKEDAIAQFDDFVAEVLAAPAAAEFDGIYEEGGSY